MKPPFEKDFYMTDLEELQQIIDAATPGPWSYEYTRLGHTVRQPGSYRALMVVNHAEQPEADGRLIALAPQLAAEVARLTAERDVLHDTLINTAAHLAAAISLLERGGKKAAASDKMFAQMLNDYRKSLDRARAAINPEAK